jgi:NAD(P)H-dependent FMN reductase
MSSIIGMSGSLRHASFNRMLLRAAVELIVTPEYNNSIPGVLKNAIHWLSRPAADIPRVFHGRPGAIMGATPGRAFVEGFAAFVERQSDRQSPTAVAQEVIAKGR